MKIKKLSNATLLMLLCWLVYACSYIGKVNYAANINEVMSFYGVEHASAGLVSTFFFAYGVGQVVNGILCKKYNLKWIIFLSLFVSGFINFMVGVSDNFVLVKYLWLINGFSMSILWPTLIRLLSENLMQKDMAKASLIGLSTDLAVGTKVTVEMELYVTGTFDQYTYISWVDTVWTTEGGEINGETKVVVYEKITENAGKWIKVTFEATVRDFSVLRINSAYPTVDTSAYGNAVFLEAANFTSATSFNYRNVVITAV